MFETPIIYKGIEHKERIVRAKEALKIVGLENRENHLPNEMSRGWSSRKSCYCASYS